VPKLMSREEGKGMESVQSKLTEILRHHSDQDESKWNQVPQTGNLAELGFIDSFGFLSAVEEMEKHFKITLDFSEYDPDVFLSLQGLSDIVQRKVNS